MARLERITKAKRVVKQYHVDNGLEYIDKYWYGAYIGNDVVYAIMKQNKIISVFKIDKDYKHCSVMNVEELNEMSVRPRIIDN